MGVSWRRCYSIVLTDYPRYHVPEHVTKYIDYIVPGLRLMKNKKSTAETRRAKRVALNLQERGLRAGSEDFNIPIIGPILNATLGNLLSNLTQQNSLSMCDTYITPPCIAGQYPLVIF